MGNTRWLRLLTLALVALVGQAGPVFARVDPLQVVSERLVRPEIVVVLDTSGSMAWRPSSSRAVGNDCGGDRRGTVDLCGDGLCSGTEGSAANRCSIDCNIGHHGDGVAGAPPQCDPFRTVRSPSRMQMVKRVLHNVLPDLRRSANFGLFTFEQRGYYRYYLAAPKGQSRKVTAYLSREVMATMGAWNASQERPRQSFTSHGTQYVLLSSAGMPVGKDSLYVRSDDLSRHNRFRWTAANITHFDGTYNWSYRGSYYTYWQRPVNTGASRLETAYMGPQYVDPFGRTWIYHRFNHAYTSQGISHRSSGAVVEPLSGTDDQLINDNTFYRIMGRLAPASQGGVWSWGNTPTGPAILAAGEHFRQREVGHGAFAGRGPDASATCRGRYVLLLTDGQSNSGVSPWSAARQVYRQSMSGTSIKTLVIGLPGLPSSAVSELDRVADMGDDGKSNSSKTAYFASNETALVRVIKEALLEMTRGDYTTTPVSVATVGDTLVAGNVAMVPSTEYPGWRGHLRAMDLRTNPRTKLWDAGEVLQRRSWSSRKLYTGLTTTNGGDPVPLLSSTGQVNLNGGCNGCGGVGIKQVWREFGRPPTNAQIKGLVLWLAGKNRPWKLGPVLRTIPATVGIPPKYDLPGHSDFRKTYASRERLVYVTSNDGLLHAFRANDGSEAFAYLPPNLLPAVMKLWQQGGQPVELDRFRWLLASSPRVEDSPPASAPQSWRTKLVLTMGPGGAAYAELDITNPSSCSALACQLNDPPFRVTAHSRTVATSAVMGETWSNPALFFTTSLGTRQLHAAMGSGYGPGSSGHHYNHFASLNKAPRSKLQPDPGNGVDYTVLTDTVAIVEQDSDLSVVATYQGDLAGRLVRYDKGEPGSGVNVLNEGIRRPIYSSPAVYYRGSGNTLIAVASGSHDERKPVRDMEAVLYLRSETSGVTDTSNDNVTCKASQVCSASPGCPASVPTKCKAPSKRAMPVGPPLILKNRISKTTTQFEAFYLLYDPPATSCGAGSSWLVRVSTDGTNQQVVSSSQYVGIRATGITLVGGGMDVAVAHIGMGGEDASVFTVMRDKLLPTASGSAPYIEAWREVERQVR